MSTVTQYKLDPTRSVSPTERDAKNPVLTRITAMDMMGLTWILQDEDFTYQFMRDC